ncbi:DUF3789 domain-containing protein [Ammonifex thiophilus]|uniref:DUF3789 domain-containing protein n=1 Tax=Ammonifex thiophilus TaxID=444093 RepID=A0A3D8P2L0_9THEO|nr:DUF3789 domain-containing protein [Ammonifex thiophilus]RDV80749.1 DUF3789 domain-containing protein [Ammonifex thiophilus]
MSIAWFLAGVFVGGFFGFLTACLCQAAGRQEGDVEEDF